MKRAIIAGSIYFVILFAIGFAFGTIRVLVLAPRFGDLAATMVEVPIMLGAAFLVCRWVIRRWQVTARWSHRWTMVVIFLLLLVLFETGLGALLFNRSIAGQFAVLATAAGVLGLSAQIVAALFPVFLAGAPETQ